MTSSDLYENDVREKNKTYSNVIKRASTGFFMHFSCKKEIHLVHIIFRNLFKNAEFKFAFFLEFIRGTVLWNPAFCCHMEFKTNDQSCQSH